MQLVQDKGGSLDKAVRLHTACMFRLSDGCRLDGLATQHRLSTRLQQRAAEVSNNHSLVYRVLVWV
ncbi:unnamed protein product, partial [Ectocarpus sp. 8 AP-2014]